MWIFSAKLLLLWLSTLGLVGYFFVLSNCLKTPTMFTSITQQVRYQILTKIAPIMSKY